MCSQIKCSHCKFHGKQSDFPLGHCFHYLKTCKTCPNKINAQKSKKNSGESGGSKRRLGRSGPGELSTLPWDSFILLLSENRDHAFELNAYVTLPCFNECEGTHEVAKKLACYIWDATGYRFKRRGDYALGTLRVDFSHFCQASINQEMYAYRSGLAKFGSKCTQNRSELKTWEPFFFSHQCGGRWANFFSYGVGFHCSKGATADLIPCLQRPTKRFLYSGRIRVHWQLKVSVLREDWSLVIFSNFSVCIGLELGHFLRSFLYAPGSEFHQDSPPPGSSKQFNLH